jgi:putative PIN family toxin of toxin-antitoxin system
MIAAFISRGHSHELLEHLARHHDLFTSEFILDEFRRTLMVKFRMTPSSVESAVDLQLSRMEVVSPAPLSGVVEPDPDDDVIVATALAARADCLITGDQALLKLRAYEGVPIVLPSAFWELERGV